MSQKVSLSLGRRPTDSDVTYKVCKDELGLKFLCTHVPMYSVTGTNEGVAFGQQLKLEPLYPFGLKVQVPKDTPIKRFSLNNVMELAKLHSPIILKGLDAMQYTSEITDDFRRIASDGLSLSILHEGIATSKGVSKAASYIVQISTLQEASTASEGKATYYRQEQECLMGPLGKSLEEVENIR